MAHPGGHHLGRGGDALSGDQTGGLADEQGVTASPVGNQPDDVGGDRRPDACLQQPSDVDLGQPGQVDLFDAGAGQGRPGRPQDGSDLGRAERRDDQHRVVGQFSEGVPQYLQGLLAGAVDVVQNHHQRLGRRRPRPPAQELHHCPRHPERRDRRRTRGRRPTIQQRPQATDQVAVFRTVRISETDAHQLADDVGPGPGGRHALDLRTATPRRVPAAAGQPGGQRRGQRRLPRAGLATDPNDPEHPAGSGLRGRIQHGKLTCPPDQAGLAGRRPRCHNPRQPHWRQCAPLRTQAARRTEAVRTDAVLTEAVPLGARQPERVRQQPHRGRAGGISLASLDLADSAHANPGPRCQVLLRQPQPTPVRAHDITQHPSPHPRTSTRDRSVHDNRADTVPVSTSPPDQVPVKCRRRTSLPARRSGNVDRVPRDGGPGTNVIIP